MIQNGMLRHTFGGAVIFLSLQHFFVRLELLPHLHARACEGGNKGALHLFPDHRFPDR